MRYSFLQNEEYGRQQRSIIGIIDKIFIAEQKTTEFDDSSSVVFGKKKTSDTICYYKYRVKPIFIMEVCVIWLI